MLVDVADEEIIVLVPLMLVQLTHNLLLLRLLHLLFLDLLQMQLQKALPDLLACHSYLALLLDIDVDEIELSHCYSVAYGLKELPGLVELSIFIKDDPVSFFIILVLSIQYHQAKSADLRIIYELLLDLSLEYQGQDHIVEDVDIDELVSDRDDVSQEVVYLCLADAHIPQDVDEGVGLDEVVEQMLLALFFQLLELLL